MKRRKWMRRIALLAACLVLSGCSGREEVPAQKQKETQIPVTETQTQKEETTEGTTETTTMFEFPTDDEAERRNEDRYVADLSKESGIDIDLTVLNATMTYAQVNDMMVTPENYVGKKVKMAGQYAEFFDDETGKRYYACIIKDALACCAQGIEFVPTEAFTYPDDYPLEEDNVTVIGIFDIYLEDGYRYVTLTDAVFDFTYAEKPL